MPDMYVLEVTTQTKGVLGTTQRTLHYGPALRWKIRKFLRRKGYVEVWFQPNEAWKKVDRATDQVARLKHVLPLSHVPS